MKILAFVVITVFLIEPLFSQNESIYILPRLKIYQKEKGKVAYYSFEKYNYNRFIVGDSFLTADPLRYNYKVNVIKIDKIAIRNGTSFWPVAAGGAALGYILGFFFWGFFTIGDPGGGPGPPVEFSPGNAIIGGFIFAVPFGLLGGLIGLLAPAYDDYDVSKIPNNSKKLYLKKVFKKNQIRTF